MGPVLRGSVLPAPLSSSRPAGPGLRTLDAMPTKPAPGSPIHRCPGESCRAIAHLRRASKGRRRGVDPARPSLPSLRELSRRGLVDQRAEARLADRQKQALDLRASDLSLPVSSLSGGNQQKVVLARWLALSPRVVLFDEPTRGVDVGAKAEIYRLMRGLSDRGVGVLMISSDMEEVIGVSDRVLVMHEGRIAGSLTRDQLSEQAILTLAVGQPEPAGPAQ